MIFIFNESLKNIDVEAKGVLAKLVIAIIEKKHYLQTSAQIWQWLERKVLTNQFLGLRDIECILKNREFRDITGTMRSYLTQINVGYRQGDIEPSKAMLLVNRPSYIVVENEANDWSVLRKWIELMKNERAFKSINTLVELKKCVGDIRPYNAGSSGQIINTLKERINEFKELSGYKVMAVYDSDKNSKNADLSNEKKKIQEFLTHKQLMGHMLYKREMENYFCLECYIKAQMADNELIYPFSIDAWDFEDVEKYIEVYSAKRYKKQNLPMLGSYIDKQKLINITAHHPVIHNGTSINEVQSLILKFAKLI